MELTIEEALKQGVAAHREGKLQDAERLYREILQSQPTHPDANHNLGLILVAVNKAEEALFLFKTALEGNPKVEQSWLSYIGLLIKVDQLDNAKQALQQAKKLGMDGAGFYSLEAQLSPKSEKPPKHLLNTLLGYYENGRYSDAEKLAITLTKEFPSHQLSWKVLGAVLKHQGRVSESLEPVRTSVKLAPQDADAYFNLGNTLKDLMKFDEAKSSYKQAIALNPDFAEAHNNLGVTLQEQRKFEEAEISHRQALTIESGYAAAHFNLGNILRELGRLDEAEDSYLKAIINEPNYVQAHFNLGNTLKELGRLDDAEASYKQVLAIQCNYVEAHNNLGNTLAELGRLDEAKASYEQAIILRPNYCEAHNNLGITLKKLGRPIDSAATFSKAISLNPKYVEAYNNLGAILKGLGKLDDAAKYFAQAIALNPYFAEAYNNLGSTLQGLGRLKEAEAKYEKAIELKPEYADAYSNLGIILLAEGDDVGSLNCFQKSSELTRKSAVRREDPREAEFRISKAKICHDIEQFKYLASMSVKKEFMSDLASEYQRIVDRTQWSSDSTLLSVPPEFCTTLAKSFNLLHRREAGRVDVAVNRSLEIDLIYEKYFSHEFGLAYVDNFLSPDALESLRKFLLESTIWFGQKKGGYLGAYLSEGLASPLILQIASELKSRFPGIIKNHALNQAWAYKYDSRSSNLESDTTGIQVHADFAAVNVNFWVTPTVANLDPNSGGLIVYNKEAPPDWDFHTYNANLSRIHDELRKSDYDKEVIPYRENRMVIFNSDLFHETDYFHFKNGYENRRINVTMLFGKREGRQ